MERVRRYLNEETGTTTEVDEAGGLLRTRETTPLEEQRSVDDEETRSFLSCGRIEARSSDAKSIGSLSQHLLESDDDDNDKYYGTCNGYASHPGSKSNLLLCTECDLLSKTCAYRPQTPSQYGRFVEERIDRQCETTKAAGGAAKHQQERRGSTVPAIMKSPMRVEGSPRYRRDEGPDRADRRSKSVTNASAIIVGASNAQEQDRPSEHPDSRHHEARSPSSVWKNSALRSSPRYHGAEHRGGTKRAEQPEGEVEEGKNRRIQERYHESRSPVPICDRSPRRQEIAKRVWTQRQEQKDAEDQNDPEESDESPPCPLCNAANGSNGISRCAHCNLSSDQDDADLICFQCQMSAEEETTSVDGSVCPKCENVCSTRYGTNGSGQATSSSSEGTKYHVDAVVKIQINNRSFDVDSDETIDSDPSNNRDSSEAGNGSIDRLETIVEAKNDTASENGEDNGSKINGQPRTKYLNYMIVLFL